MFLLLQTCKFTNNAGKLGVECLGLWTVYGYLRVYIYVCIYIINLSVVRFPESSGDRCPMCVGRRVFSCLGCSKLGYFRHPNLLPVVLAISIAFPWETYSSLCSFHSQSKCKSLQILGKINSFPVSWTALRTCRDSFSCVFCLEAFPLKAGKDCLAPSWSSLWITTPRLQCQVILLDGPIFPGILLGCFFCMVFYTALLVGFH